MSREFATQRMLLNAIELRNETTDPSSGIGAQGPIGSFWLRDGNYPTRPTEMYLKTASPDAAWAKQNLVNLNVQNVQNAPYNAVGDGVTDDTAAIQAAINACVAAGGGIVYFPPASVSYRVTKIGLQSFLLSNVHDITFLGDGPKSLIAMIGNAALGEWHMFTLRNGTTRIKFLNLAFTGVGITNPDPANQAHIIQINGVAGDPNGGANDIEISGCYFGQIKGAGIRNLAESGEEVSNIRVFSNCFDMVAARSNIEAQRYSRRVQFKWNWCTGTASGNLVDFEPTGGTGLGTAGPEEWQVIGNCLDNGANNTDSITCGGAGSADPARRNIFAFNILAVGGGIQGGNCVSTAIIGNIVTVSNTIAGEGIIDLQRKTDDLQVYGNVLVALNNTGSRYGVRLFDSSSIAPALANVSHNIIAIMNSNALGAFGIDFESITEGIANDNIITMDSTVNIVTVGIQMRAVLQNLDHGIANGNMVLATTNAMAQGIKYSASPNNVLNTAASYNFIDNCFSGIRWERAAAQLFLNWRMCAGNNITNATNAGVEYPATNVGITHEGTAGPGEQIAALNLAAGPEGNVTAPPGSVCLNIGGGISTIFWVKETGTGNTGWVRDGDSEFQFATQSLGTATAARFLATGIDQAAVGTVEIKMAMPRPGTLRNLRITQVAGTTAENNTFVVRKNGVNTSMAVILSNTGVAGSDTSHTVAVAQTDLISVQVTKASAPAAGATNVVCAIGMQG